MKEPFKLPLSQEQAESYLLAAVIAEVDYRHRIFIISDALKLQISKAAHFLTNNNGKFCLFLCGGCGNGKSTMMKAIQNLINALNINDSYNGTTYGLQILAAKELATISQSSNEQWRSIYMRRMLAVDDLGTEAVETLSFGNTLTPMTDLLTCRYDEQLFTIVSSNLTPAQVHQKYGLRIADRLNEMATIIVYKNPSYRNINNNL